MTLLSSFLWFLDSYTSQHLCNDWGLFTNTRTKNIDFVTAAGQVIWTEEIGTVCILWAGATTIKFQKMVLVLWYNSTLILLDQIRESDMTLLRSGEVIAYTKRSENLSTHDLDALG